MIFFASFKSKDFQYIDDFLKIIMSLLNSYRIFDIMNIQYPTESIIFMVTVKIRDNHKIFTEIQNVKIAVDIISFFLLSTYTIKFIT